MSIRFEGPVEVGPVRVGVLSETVIMPSATRRGVFFLARKRPRVILMARQGVVTGVDVEGRAVDPDEIDRLSPEARAKMGG